MAVRYTDVDVMLLNRWEEVSALREAFDELLGRMTSVVELALQRAIAHINEKGFHANADAKFPCLAFWKPEWVNRKEDGIYGEIVGFAPGQFGKRSYPHPQTLLNVEDFGALRMVESPAQFSGALNKALNDDLRSAWSHQGDVAVTPLGREYLEVAERDRVLLMRDSMQLAAFLTARFDEFTELEPFIAEVLRRMTKR